MGIIPTTWGVPQSVKIFLCHTRIIPTTWGVRKAFRSRSERHGDHPHYVGSTTTGISVGDIVGDHPHYVGSTILSESSACTC